MEPLLCRDATPPVAAAMERRPLSRPRPLPAEERRRVPAAAQVRRSALKEARRRPELARRAAAQAWAPV
eukprot:4266875-Prymnesium_polylepis.1